MQSFVLISTIKMIERQYSKFLTVMQFGTPCRCVPYNLVIYCIQEDKENKVLLYACRNCDYRKASILINNVINLTSTVILSKFIKRQFKKLGNLIVYDYYPLAAAPGLQPVLAAFVSECPTVLIFYPNLPKSIWNQSILQAVSMFLKRFLFHLKILLNSKLKNYFQSY